MILPLKQETIPIKTNSSPLLERAPLQALTTNQPSEQFNKNCSQMDKEGRKKTDVRQDK